MVQNSYYLFNMFKLKIFLNFYYLSIVDSYQYHMESSYQEKSMLTNLFTENKFLGWFGLFIIFFAIFAIFVFQFLEWESKDNNKK